jgi:hypothetical protein
MTKSISNHPLIETPKGLGKLEKVYLSDLGFLMLRIDNLDGTYTTYNLGKHKTQENIFTNELMKQVGNVSYFNK